MRLALFLVAAPLQSAVAQESAKLDVLWQKLEQRVAELDRRLDGVLAVAIKDLTDGRTVGLRPDAVMPVASTIKIAVLAELYRQDQSGKGARLDDPYVVDSADAIPESDLLAGMTHGLTRLTNRDLATFMIGVSDNGATNILIRRLGMDRVNRLLDSLGLKETRLRRRMLDLAAARAGRENTATPGELVGLLEALWKPGLLEPGGRDDFFRLLATPKERYLPRLLPADARIASKPGWLDGVRADAGIGFVANRPFAIAVMITYAGDGRAAEQIIAELGLAAWEHFDRIGRSSPYGRVIR
ncbi:MAG: serine hydrolase [Gemmatimonadales bacterium]